MDFAPDCLFTLIDVDAIVGWSKDVSNMAFVVEIPLREDPRECSTSPFIYIGTAKPQVNSMLHNVHCLSVFKKCACLHLYLGVFVLCLCVQEHCAVSNMPVRVLLHDWFVCIF